MVPVKLDRKAEKQLADAPRFLRPKLYEAMERLTHWPEVSGVKPLRGDRQGQMRIRVRDWRIIFRCEPNQVIVEQINIIEIGDRKDIYEE